MEDESLPIDADKVVALPLDELALLVLRDAKARGEWNWRNGMGHFRPAYAQRPDALEALAEGWSWLYTHGLIAGNYAQPSADAITISRRGHAMLESGLGWLRAVERLDVDLVPVLEHKARPQFLRGDFETAAFVAMKEVEVQVRSRARLSDSLAGTKLIQEALKPGPPRARCGGLTLIPESLSP